MLTQSKIKQSILAVLAIAVLVSATVFFFRRQDGKVVSFGYRINIPQVYTDPLQIQTDQGYDFSVVPQGAEAATKSGERSTVHFVDAYERSDVVYTIENDRVKEDILLKAPGHPEKFSYRIDVSQYDFEKNERGDWLFSPKGKASALYTVFTIPAPFMTDANGQESGTSAVATTLSADGILTLTPDATWLAAAAYPVILDPTISINILNVHSHPQQGENWTVEFTTLGMADLRIVPNDQATIDDDVFVSLKCDGEVRNPQILAGDVIYYPNWQCDGVGEVVHYTQQAGSHTLRFEFGDKLIYAYNSTLDYATAETASISEFDSTNIEGSMSLSAVKGAVLGAQNNGSGNSGAAGWDPAVFANANYVYVGNNIQPSVNRKIGATGFYVGVIGNVSSLTFYSEVWTIDGSGNLSTLVATSQPKTGLTDSTWSTFVFDHEITLSSGTNYAIVLRRSDYGYNASNHLQLPYDNINWTTGELASSYAWLANGTQYQNWSNEWAVRLYDFREGFYKGRYGFKATGDGTNNNANGTLNFTDQDEVYERAFFYLPSDLNGTLGSFQINDLFSILDSGFNRVLYVGFQSDGSGNLYRWYIQGSGSGSTNSTTNFSADVWHQIELYYKKGTGSDAVYKVWIDGDLLYDQSGGSATLQASRNEVGVVYWNSILGNGSSIYFDDVVVSSQRVGGAVTKIKGSLNVKGSLYIQY